MENPKKPAGNGPAIEPLTDGGKAIQLGPSYDRDTIRAEQSEGVLVVTIPKRPEARPRHIEIKA